jgi:protein TonB
VIEKAPPPPPPPPPPEPVVEEIFKVVEDMPRFPGCEDMGGTKQEKKACADKKMLEFIYKNIKYPAIARENGVDGTVVIQFVVEKDGSITDAKIVRDIGATCGAEALRVVNLMNQEGYQWIPGKQRGRPVKVQFNLPVKFKLE